MAQGAPSTCPQCRAPVAANQRFCTRCGFKAVALQTAQPPDAGAWGTTVPPGAGQQWVSSQAAETRTAYIPPVPPNTGPPVLPNPSPLPLQQPAPGQPGNPQFAQMGPPPAWFSPPQPTSMPITGPVKPVRTSGKGKIVLVVGLLMVLVILGAAAFVAAPLLGLGKSQPAITTTNINTVVSYAGIDVYILDVQQAASFIDNPKSSTDGMLRLHLRQQNTTNVPVNFDYARIGHLLLPGGKQLSPVSIKGGIGVAPGTNSENFFDFAVATTIKVDQIQFRLGADSEAQMDIPLTSKANLSTYQSATMPIKGHLQYAGLDWNLDSATTQLGIEGKQATKGMRYITITLKVDNPLAQTAISGSAFDYVRLKAGNATITPTSTTLPVSFESRAKGKTGTVTFLIAQNAKALTLILSQGQNGFDQATADFQLPS